MADRLKELVSEITEMGFTVLLVGGNVQGQQAQPLAEAATPPKKGRKAKADVEEATTESEAEEPVVEEVAEEGGGDFVLEGDTEGEPTAEEEPTPAEEPTEDEPVAEEEPAADEEPTVEDATEDAEAKFVVGSKVLVPIINAAEELVDEPGKVEKLNAEGTIARVSFENYNDMNIQVSKLKAAPAPAAKKATKPAPKATAKPAAKPATKPAAKPAVKPKVEAEDPLAELDVPNVLKERLIEKGYDSVVKVKALLKASLKDKGKQLKLFGIPERAQERLQKAVAALGKA